MLAKGYEDEKIKMQYAFNIFLLCAHIHIQVGNNYNKYITNDTIKQSHVEITINMPRSNKRGPEDNGTS